jgi:hypothetical protein
LHRLQSQKDEKFRASINSVLISQQFGSVKLQLFRFVFLPSDQNFVGLGGGLGGYQYVFYDILDQLHLALEKKRTQIME